jgi:ABC-type phosphate transport system substrate-binding protein
MARLASAVLCLLLLVAARPAAGGEGLLVIVPVDRAADLGVEEVAQIYLRQRRFWDDGEPIIPVNRDAESAERRLFTRLVFRGEARRLATYWNRQYFRGVLPPATLASDEAVKRFVASERKAIGYIAPASVDDSVRVVLHLTAPR